MAKSLAELYAGEDTFGGLQTAYLWHEEAPPPPRITRADRFDRKLEPPDHVTATARRLAARFKHWPVTRAELIEYANETGARPSFLFPPEPATTDDERATLLAFAKLVYGMAKAGYGFDPHAARNKATADIAADLVVADCPMDDATVLKYLRQAAKLLGKL